MCLAIPGKVMSLTEDEPIMRSGRVSFGGVVRKVNMAFVPEARVNDYVLVHAGVAIQIIDEAEAEKTFACLRELDCSGGEKADSDEIC